MIKDTDLPAIRDVRVPLVDVLARGASRYFGSAPSRGTVEKRAEAREQEPRKRRGDTSVEDSEAEEEAMMSGQPASKGALSKRGRGRPPTTGEYVGLAQAKRDLAAAEREALAVQMDKEIAEMARREIRTRSLSRSSSMDITPLTSDGEFEEVTADDVEGRVKAGLTTIMGVATKSKNLSGTCVKALKDATLVIGRAVGQMLHHSTSAETRALKAANARLKGEVEDMKRRMEDLRREMDAARSHAAPAAQGMDLEELLQRTVREAVAQSSARMDARIEGLAARLLPEPCLRPPLAADKKKKKSAQEPATPAVSTLKPPLNPGPAQKKVKGKKPAAKPAVCAEPVPQAPEETEAADQPDTWAEVVGRKKAAKARKEKEKEEEPKKKAPGNKKKRKRQNRRRVPKSAAVMLTLQPGAEERGVSYASLLRTAKQRIDLHALDIPAVKFRLSVTGSRLLEIT